MKKLWILFVTSVVICSALPNTASATENTSASVSASASENIQPYTEGLIYSHSIDCSAGNKTIYINADVNGSTRMSKIGFKDIKIERSSDKVNWTTEKNIGDNLAEDTDSHEIVNKAVSVQGGYYYRVTLINYAKEKTWLFPTSQSEEDTSGYVWIA